MRTKALFYIKYHKIAVLLTFSFIQVRIKTKSKCSIASYICYTNNSILRKTQEIVALEGMDVKKAGKFTGVENYVSWPWRPAASTRYGCLALSSATILLRQGGRQA